ncbi:MAG: hypothetical protein OXI01_09955 [Albidovulum sp.]|nr:hypothetical protein [Albidovulum sp.]
MTQLYELKKIGSTNILYLQQFPLRRSGCAETSSVPSLAVSAAAGAAADGLRKRSVPVRPIIPDFEEPSSSVFGRMSSGLAGIESTLVEGAFSLDAGTGRRLHAPEGFPVRHLDLAKVILQLPPKIELALLIPLRLFERRSSAPGSGRSGTLEAALRLRVPVGAVGTEPPL